jgi:hypothetical protein
MFELQAALVRDVFLGHVKLPDKNQWQADVNECQIREKAIGPTDVFRDVSFESVVDTKNKKKSIQVSKPWIENKDDSMENLLKDYRNKL